MFAPIRGHALAEVLPTNPKLYVADPLKVGLASGRAPEPAVGEVGMTARRERLSDVLAAAGWLLTPEQGSHPPIN